VKRKQSFKENKKISEYVESKIEARKRSGSRSFYRYGQPCMVFWKESKLELIKKCRVQEGRGFTHIQQIKKIDGVYVAYMILEGALNGKEIAR